jgi:hypothetical protein
MILESPTAGAWNNLAFGYSIHLLSTQSMIEPVTLTASD